MAGVFLKAMVKIKKDNDLKFMTVNGQHGSSGFPL